MISLPQEVQQRIKNIKLIVSDVDGTLISSKNGVGEQTVELVKKLKQKGVLFTFATQRVHSSIVPFAEKLEIELPIITVNGALIKDLKNNVLQKSVISPKKVLKAISFSDRFYVRTALVYDDEIVYTEDNSVLKDYMYRLGTNYRLVDSYYNYLDKVVEIIMLGNERKVVKYIQKKMNYPFKYFLNAKYYRTSSSLGIYNLEIRCSGTNKKRALRKLTGHLGIRRSQVATIGDWYNDRDLFEYGGFNVALQNAIPELKAMSDLITERTNEEDGVAEFLKYLYDSI